MINGDTYTPTPRGNPRLRPEGRSFAERNREGCGERWYDYSRPEADEAPKGVERITSQEARRNADVHKGSTNLISSGFDYSTPPKRTTYPRAITEESADIAAANKGHEVRHLISDYGNCTPDAPPAVKVIGDEAQGYADRNMGTVERIIGEVDKTPSSVCVQDISSDVTHISRIKQQDHMSDILRMEPVASRPESKRRGRMHEESQESWDQLQPTRHCRPEGQEICRNMSNNMAGIMSMTSELSANANTNARPHMTQSKTPETNVAHTRICPEGMQNYQRDKSSASMDAIFSRDTTVVPRTVKINRMMQRSEEW